MIRQSERLRFSKSDFDFVRFPDKVNHILINPYETVTAMKFITVFSVNKIFRDQLPFFMLKNRCGKAIHFIGNTFADSTIPVFLYHFMIFHTGNIGNHIFNSQIRTPFWSASSSCKSNQASFLIPWCQKWLICSKRICSDCKVGQRLHKCLYYKTLPWHNPSGSRKFFQKIFRCQCHRLTRISPSCIEI